ncbi:hypothetical protein IFM51744_04393 [Aspergillus udagawae]|nr:hypothetical protein IFM51744_04393 [Aspergillus udagawae]
MMSSFGSTSRRDPGSDRSWTSAVQKINGINSILTLVPILTGKVQNIKLIASRIYPASFVIGGIGAGRVLLKFQLGILLCSHELYRNTISDISYFHDEYVNKFSPILEHVPTDTPERHSSGTIINHNLAETYMIEAWFRSQGDPSIATPRHTSKRRTIIGSIIFSAIYAAEAYIASRNVAIGAENVYIIFQAICAVTWLAAILIVQVKRGDGKQQIKLNATQRNYRYLKLPMLGKHISSQILSFHHDHLTDYMLFGSEYEQKMLTFAGMLFLTSAILDILSTIIVIGLTTWAYVWIGLEIGIVAVKVVFCVEPLRQTELQNITPARDLPLRRDQRLPLIINLRPSLECKKVCVGYNIFEEKETGHEWQSASAGIYVGQRYVRSKNHSMQSKFLAIEDDVLFLADSEPTKEDNDRLQREFLAALKSVVEANKIPSEKFVAAVQSLVCNLKTTMSPEWVTFGAKDAIDAVNRASRDLKWRRFC